MTNTFLNPSLQVNDQRPIITSNIEEQLDKFRLNWEVETQPLHLANGTQTAFLGVVRKDTHEVFQTVTKSYVPMQNGELMDIALQVADMMGSEIEVCNPLSNGAVTYISIKGRTLPIEGATAGDVIGEKMTLVNSHDGSRAFGIGFGHVILSCTNGMTRFDRKGYISVRHTQSMKNKVQSIANGWRRLEKESTQMIGSYALLMDKPIGQEEVKTVFEMVSGIDPETPANQLSTRAKNIATNVMNSIRSEMSYKGQTAWGLLNGATHYTTQLAGKGDSQLKSKMFGGNAKKDLKVWEYLMGL